MRSRIQILGIIFLVATAALLARLYYWQIIKGESLSVDAKAQQVNREKISGNRGKILSSDNSVLAGNQMQWTLFAYTPDVKTNPFEIANKLSPILVLNDEEKDQAAVSTESGKLSQLLANMNKVSWIPLKNRINRDQKAAIEKLQISGLGFDEHDTRLYPEGTTSAHLLGFVGKDDSGEDTGYFGLEGYYNLLLSGKSGVKEVTANAVGVPLSGSNALSDSTFQGSSLVTTINKPIQIMAEQELRRGLEKYQSESGSVVIMDAKTGGILALASEPGFDPAKYYEGSDALFRNPVISDSFEPGSIMKPIVMASALDAGLISPDTVCDICNGPYHVAEYVIRTWNNQYFAGTTMRDVIIHSDNVGMVFIGNKLGTERLIKYFDKFGFGKSTNIDLQGEYSAPMRDPAKWGEVERDTASFGQGIAVTGIQMLKAMSAIANNGVLLNPHLVSEVRVGDLRSPRTIPQGEQVISSKAAAQMTDIMVDAIQKGEAKWAAPKDYELAGKTGTAQVAIGGGYDESKTNASFIGFGPAHNPRFIMLITLKEPKSSPWAAETAAPLWFRMAVNVLHYLGVPPRQ